VQIGDGCLKWTDCILGFCYEQQINLLVACL